MRLNHVSRPNGIRAPAPADEMTSDISFEATYDLRLCHSFARTTANILLGWLMVAQAHEDDAVEGSVGLAGRPVSHLRR